MKRSLIALIILGVFSGLGSCTKDSGTDTLPFLIFKQGSQFIRDGDYIPVGARMTFGISAVGGSSAITNFRVWRITAAGTLTELDKGLFLSTGGLDTAVVFIKGEEELETWTFFIQNANRDTASIQMTIYRGEGSAYGPIHHYPSIFIGYPGNTDHPPFLSLQNGLTYASSDVSGHEQEVDLASFYYISSGKSSPTLTCPAYPSALTHYPEFSTWPVNNSTVYDYRSVDYDLVSPVDFDHAANDSLLVASYSPQNVSGLCKFCYTGKIVPFRTAGGKYGLIKVVHADESEGGYMELEVKIQQ